MKLVTTNLDPFEDSVEPLVELILDHSHLTPQMAEAVVRGLLEFCWASDIATSERD